MDLSELREQYQGDGIDAGDLASNPIVQFQQWFDDVRAANYWEPNAMVVSTIDDEGRPTARNVLLKAFDPRGFVFYTNYQSAKGQHLIARPAVSLTFSWIELRRQVRIDGAAEKLSAAESDAYFGSRPRGSQLGAWASAQSTPVADRAALDGQWRKAEARFAASEVPRPPHWGGFLVRPRVIEFWQGRQNRLHDRFRYSSTGETWNVDRLAP